MAGSRRPGSTGLGSHPEPIDDGTMCRSASPRPGFVCATHVHVTGKIEHAATGRRQRPSIVVKRGDHNENVKKLQALLNLRLTPAPPLAVDGIFGPLTQRAVVQYQKARSLVADGIAGKKTWFDLILDPKPISVEFGRPVEAPASASPAPQRPAAPKAQSNLINDWPLAKKCDFVAEHIPRHLLPEARAQLAGLISVQTIGAALLAYVISWATGAGELVTLGLLLIFGEQVLLEIADALQIISLAWTTDELDDAADHIAKAIAMMGVGAAVGFLLKKIGKGGKSGVEVEEPEQVPQSTRPRAKRVEPENTEPPQKAPPPPPTRNPIPEGQDPFEYYMKKAESLEVSTKPNEAVVYSGRGGLNRAAAETFAAKNGKLTLEKTTGGSWLDGQRLFDDDSPLTQDQAREVWKVLSRRYAEQASGNVVGFVEGAAPDGIFETVEYPALKANPKVTNVVTGGF